MGMAWALLCKTSELRFVRKKLARGSHSFVERTGGMSAMQNQCGAAVDGIFDFA
jgi:hypothetical protein